MSGGGGTTAGIARSVEWRAVVDSLHEAVVAVDAGGEIVYANAAAGRLLGWDELVGRPLVALIPPRFRDRHRVGFLRYVATGAETILGRPVRVPALRPDGTEVPIEMLLTAIDSGQSSVVIGLLRDVTDRLELESPGDLADQIVASLTAAADLDEVLSQVLEAVGTSLGWDVAQLWLVDDATGAMTVRCGWHQPFGGLDEFADASAVAMRRGEGLPGRVWEREQPVWVTDVAQDVALGRREVAIAAGIESGFAAPVLSGGRVVGALEVFAIAHRDPSADQEARLAILGRELGPFIERRTMEERGLALLESERAARTEAERAQRRLRFVSDASAALAESLDVGTTLDRVATLAVPTLGDWCVVHVLDEGVVRLGAARHTDPAMVERLRAAHERYPVELEASGGVGAAIRTGTTRIDTVVDDGVLAGIARSDEHLELLRSLRFGSVATIPLIARDRSLGAITVAREAPGGLDERDVAVVEDLARRCAISLDNAQLHERLRFSAALLHAQSEAGMEGQLVVTLDGRVLSYNQRFAEMWGVTEAVLASGRDDALLDAAARRVADPDSFLGGVRELYDRPVPIRDEIELRDGRTFDRFGTPLITNDEPIGYAWYFRDVTDQKVVERDLAEVGTRFASVAQTLQQSLLPPELPVIPGVEAGARFHPAGDGSIIGGDFYDVFRVGRQTWGLVVGDVCGKGALAATLTALARYTIRAAAMQTTSPARALAQLNEAMRRASTDPALDRFATVAHARFRVDDGGMAMTIALGGHPLPMVVRADGRVETVGEPGTLVGVLDKVDIRDNVVRLAPGDTIVFVTDGVLEARRGGVELGRDGLARVLAGAAGAPPAEVAARVERAALDYQGGSAQDDIAVLAVAVPPR